MEIGIIGLPGSGKTTVFNALTRGRADVASYGGKPNVGVAAVPDTRLDRLAVLYEPRKPVSSDGELRRHPAARDSLRQDTRHIRPVPERPPAGGRPAHRRAGLQRRGRAPRRRLCRPLPRCREHDAGAPLFRSGTPRASAAASRREVPRAPKPRSGTPSKRSETC